MFVRNIYIDTLTVKMADKKKPSKGSGHTFSRNFWTGNECPICWDDKFFPPLHKSYKYECRCSCHKNQE